MACWSSSKDAKALYDRAHTFFPDYGRSGRRYVAVTLERFGPPSTVLDVGAGNGAIADGLRGAGWDAGVLDISALAGCMKLPGLRKFVHCAWEFPYPLGDWHPEYLVCTDVLEHLPEVHVDTTLAGHRAMGFRAALYTICYVADAGGRRLGTPLHVCIQPENWWLPKLQALWGSVEAVPCGKRGSAVGMFLCKP